MKDETHAPGAEAAIVSALEKIYEAYKFMLWQQAGSSGLTPLQIQVLLYIDQNSDARLSDIAYYLQLSKPTTSDTLKTLERKKLIYKETIAVDKRAQCIFLSEAGNLVVNKLKGYANPLLPVLSAIPYARQRKLYTGLLQVIEIMQKHGIAPDTRMCFSCKFYRGNKHTRHFCHFLGRTIHNEEVKLHCSDHQKAL